MVFSSDTNYITRRPSNGRDHTNRDFGSVARERDADAIPINPNYHKDTKTGYIEEHDMTRRYWTGGRNK